MAIEFRCPNCSSLLSVPDVNAGQMAMCPTCQKATPIPKSESDFASRSESANNPYSDGLSVDVSSPHADPANPFSSPVAAPLQSKKPIGLGTGQPTPVDVGTIFNYAAKVWQENLGLLVGATVFVFFISFLFSFFSGFAGGMMRVNGNDPLNATLVEFGIDCTGNLVDLFLGIGLTRIYLALARRQQADFGMLFNGGDKFLPVLGTAILFGIAMLIGLLLLIVPGILLALFFWPFYYFIVDRQSAAMDSFTQGYQIAKINVGTSLLIALIGFALWIAGLLALCIGILFAAPLVGLLWATAYLMMKGEITS